MMNIYSPIYISLIIIILGILCGILGNLRKKNKKYLVFRR